MDPEVVFLIPILALVFMFALIRLKMKNKHEIRKLEARNRAMETERSLTTGELEEMIQVAVSNALADVDDRVENLSRRLDGLEKPLALSEADLRSSDDGPQPDKTLGRQRA